MALSMDGANPRDPVFKGCTRPAMRWGVPLVPLTVVSAAVILIAVWTTLLVVVLLPPIILAMRVVSAADDQQFRLLGLKFLFRWVHRNHNGRFWSASAYSPLAFTRRK